MNILGDFFNTTTSNSLHSIACNYNDLRAQVPIPNSQVSVMLASANMEAKSQLLSLKKPIKYGKLSLKVNLDYFMQKYPQD